MSRNEVPDPGHLSNEELEREHVEDLPDTDVMSLINASVAIPVDATIAANVLSDDPVAAAHAERDAELDQST